MDILRHFWTFLDIFGHFWTFLPRILFKNVGGHHLSKDRSGKLFLYGLRIDNFIENKRLEEIKSAIKKINYITSNCAILIEKPSYYATLVETIKGSHYGDVNDFN